MIIKIDGTNFGDDVFVNKLSEIATIVDKSKGSETQSGKLRRKVTGTLFSYQIEFVKNPDKDESVWNNFFDVLTAPVDFHEIELPHNDSTIKFRGAVTELSRDADNDNGEGGVTWGDTMTVAVTPEKPQRRVTLNDI